MEKSLVFTAVIPASREAVWQAWSTQEGVKTFFAPDCRIDLQPGGAYEMYFDLEASEGFRGSEGCVILAIDPISMLSFTWNAPTDFQTVRFQRTHVTIQLESVSLTKTEITLRHDGWGNSVEWKSCRRYFRRAWGKVVIPRLIQRFTSGPIQWNQN